MAGCSPARMDAPLTRGPGRRWRRHAEEEPAAVETVAASVGAGTRIATDALRPERRRVTAKGSVEAAYARALQRKRKGEPLVPGAQKRYATEANWGAREMGVLGFREPPRPCQLVRSLRGPVMLPPARCDPGRARPGAPVLGAAARAVPSRLRRARTPCLGPPGPGRSASLAWTCLC